MCACLRPVQVGDMVVTSVEMYPVYQKPSALKGPFRGSVIPMRSQPDPRGEDLAKRSGATPDNLGTPGLDSILAGLDFEQLLGDPFSPARRATDDTSLPPPPGPTFLSSGVLPDIEDLSGKGEYQYLRPPSVEPGEPALPQSKLAVCMGRVIDVSASSISLQVC